MEYSVSVENDLEMSPNGRKEPFMMIMVDESSKSPLFHESEGIDKLEEWVGDIKVAIQEARG